MQKRERILLIVTSLAVAIFLVDRAGGIDAALDLITLNSAELDALRERNGDYRRQIENLTEIQIEFDKIGRLFKTGEGRTGGEFTAFEFTEDLNSIFDEIKEGRPQIGVVRREPIEDVSEYQYLVVEVEVNRLEEALFKRLLQRFEEENIIVQQLDIQGISDTTMVNVEMKLAKIERVDAGGGNNDTGEDAA